MIFNPNGIEFDLTGAEILPLGDAKAKTHLFNDLVNHFNVRLETGYFIPTYYEDSIYQKITDTRKFILTSEPFFKGKVHVW